MSRRPRSASRISLVIGLITVGALAAGAIALAAAALRHGDPTIVSGTPAAAPTFDLGVETDSAPTPPTPSPAAAPVAEAPGAGERFLSVGSGGMWRATAGECGASAPVVERSTDGGVTWTDITPTYRGIGQVRELSAFAGTEAEMIAMMGDACEPELLRTFTQGRFWEPYPEILAASTYVSVTDPSIVITPAGELAAPCGDAWGLRASAETVALICDGSAYRLVDENWTQLAVAAPVALLIVDRDVIVAHTSPTCPSLTVTRFGVEATTASCLDGANPGTVALAAWGSDTMAWSEDQITTIIDWR